MAYEFRSRGPKDLISLAALIIAAILVLHIIFVWLNANQGNDIVSTDADWAGWLATWFIDLFTPANIKLRTFLNYGLAALFFLALGGLLRRVMRDL